MHREVLPGIHWIQEPGPAREGIARAVADAGPAWYRPGRSVHISQSAFLLVGERSLLFDTLSPAASDQILEGVGEILGGRALDYLVVSHPDVPHAGNTHRILRAHPDATLVAPALGDTHELYHLGDALHVAPGDELDLGGHRVVFVEATFLDAAMSIWMREENTRTLFPVDWLGFPLMDGEFLRCVDEIEAPVDVDRLVEFHGRVMFWFQYVEVEKVHAEIDRLWREHEPRFVAPAHGLVIREEPRRYFEAMKDVVRRVSDEGRIGVV